MTTTKNLSEVFSSDAYNLARTSPKITDKLYFHFKDLVTALSKVPFTDQSKILDFGCGSAPYRSLIPHGLYHRADYHYDGVSTDLEIINGLIPQAKSDFYDFVLSSQVLEHVTSVAEYLNEARRVLNDEGLIVLTTHGIFEDHPCPYDYWRWTADGLKTEIERNGFETISLYKLTGGQRFSFMQLDESLQTINVVSCYFCNIFIRIFRKIFKLLKNRIIHEIEKSSLNTAVHSVSDADSGPKKYVAIMIVARKKASK